MTGKSMLKTRVVLLLFVLFLAACCAMTAYAAEEDEELLKTLPGEWTEEYEEAKTALTFDENGTMSLHFSGADGAFEYTYSGTWSFEIVSDYNDQLTLRFTSTDNPLHAGSGYNVECVFGIYAESWDEDNVHVTYLVFTPVSSTGVSPFEEIIGSDWGLGMHRDGAPNANMRVVNCTDYVSLREKRSTSSKRLAKVPLGALVLAFPELGEQNGFIWCEYHDEAGYILKKYLEPIE